MARACLVDSSAFLCLEDPNERRHAETQSAFDELIANRAHMLTTNFVFDETYTLLLVRLGRARAVEWGERVRASQLRVIRVTEDQENRAWEIILEFADKDFLYTDATSFAVTEDLGVGEALAVDRHFHQFGGLQVLP